jgi:hypothetical protein
VGKRRLGVCGTPAESYVLLARDLKHPFLSLSPLGNLHLYDAISIGYTNYRRPDRRIASAVLDALGDSATVVNVGVGAGSYEPEDRSVVAVEPSLAMPATCL